MKNKKPWTICINNFCLLYEQTLSFKQIEYILGGNSSFDGHFRLLQLALLLKARTHESKNNTYSSAALSESIDEILVSINVDHVFIFSANSMICSSSIFTRPVFMINSGSIQWSTRSVIIRYIHSIFMSWSIFWISLWKKFRGIFILLIHFKNTRP